MVRRENAEDEANRKLLVVDIFQFWNADVQASPGPLTHMPEQPVACAVSKPVPPHSHDAAWILLSRVLQRRIVMCMTSVRVVKH